jgi:hypothetical protein
MAGAAACPMNVPPSVLIRSSPQVGNSRAKDHALLSSMGVCLTRPAETS